MGSQAEQCLEWQGDLVEMKQAISKLEECNEKKVILQYIENAISALENWHDQIESDELQEGLRCNSCGQLIEDGEEAGEYRYCESCIEDDMVKDED